uniref:Putative secreted peptide n=1 Tax=Anopheles braziliensis TaxID=58242 RepID=A0A2M3ZNG5_9DIPT
MRMLLNRRLLPFMLSGVVRGDDCRVTSRSSSSPLGSIVIDTVSSIVNRPLLLALAFPLPLLLLTVPLTAAAASKLSRGRLRDILAGVTGACDGSLISCCCCCCSAALTDVDDDADAIRLFSLGRSLFPFLSNCGKLLHRRRAAQYLYVTFNPRQRNRRTACDNLAPH